MKEKVFRKYDIRGIFPRDIDEQLTVKLGKAVGDIARGRVAVGRDCRPSGQILYGWLEKGILASGSAVIDLGIQTTPMTYYAAYTINPDVTVMITGSHNPSEYNGFKIMYGRNTIYGNTIQNLRHTTEKMKYPISQTTSSVSEQVSVRENYIGRLLSEFCFDRSLKVVVDAGNGTGGDVAIDVLKNLGCRVTPLYCNMDGSFPNHHPDPTVEKNLKDLRETVVREKADIGIAFDGDADRLGIIDENGNVIRGDRILIILARSVLKLNPEASIISEVKASRLFFSEVQKAGGHAVMSPTGHSLIKKAMIEENAMLAGEMSGHIFFRDRYYGYDDALYAALRLMEIIASDIVPLSSYLADLPEIFSTPEIRENCDDEDKFIIVETVTDLLEKAGYDVDTTDGARIMFSDGWGLVRASNTQPVLVMRFEAGTLHLLNDYEHLIREYIEIARRKLDAKTAGRRT